MASTRMRLAGGLPSTSMPVEGSSPKPRSAHMPDSQNTLKQVLSSAAAYLLPPLEAADQSGAAGVLSLLQDAGVDTTSAEQTLDQVNQLAEALSGAYAAIQTIAEGTVDAEDIVELIETADSLRQTIQSLRGVDDLVPGSFDRVLNYLTIQFLRRYLPQALSVLELVGALVPEEETGTRQIDFDRLLQGVRNPVALLEEV